MKEYVEGLEREFSAHERGFLHEQRRARSDYASFDREQALRAAYLAYHSKVYQVRMYAVFLLGHLSQDPDVLSFIRNEVSADSNWRVQEVLAKAFDDFCAVRGYEEALPVIDEWLCDTHPNVRRAVTEGLRIWTSRPYFRDHPGDAVSRLSDISKKHPDLVAAELETWSLETKEVLQVYRLASKLIERVAERR